MPIRPELRPLYPPHWREPRRVFDGLSVRIKLGREADDQALVRGQQLGRVGPQRRAAVVVAKALHQRQARLLPSGGRRKLDSRDTRKYETEGTHAKISCTV